MKEAKKAFESAIQENLESGCLKFSGDYVSRFQLYQAAVEWMKSDDRVKQLAIRGGGSGSSALDFRYDTSGLDRNIVRGKALEKIFQKFFTKYFGGDYMVGWDYSSPTIVIK